MIHANELRIGNYVTALKEPHKVAEILKNDAISFAPYRECPWTQYPVQMIKPIPLTEEWLVKFGFTKHEGDYFFIPVMFLGVLSNHKEKQFCIRLNSQSAFFIFSEREIFNIGQCYYVHQLQNTYFALTGKELLINSDK